MHRRPARDHLRRRSTATERILMSSQSFNSSVRPQETAPSFKVSAKCGQAILPDRVESALGNHISALPIIAAIERHQNFAFAKAAKCLIGVAGVARDAHPEHVNGRAKIDHLKPALFRERLSGGRRRPTISSARTSSGPRGVFARTPATRPFFLLAGLSFQRIGYFGFHSKMKLRICLRFFGDEVQKIPLRHQADEFAVRGQVREIRHGHIEISDTAPISRSS